VVLVAAISYWWARFHIWLAKRLWRGLREFMGDPRPFQSAGSIRGGSTGELGSNEGGEAAMATEIEALRQHLVRTRRQMRGLFCLFLASAATLMWIQIVRPKERPSLASTVQAPFRVVDAHGKTVLQVEALQDGSRLQLFTRTGQLAGAMATYRGATTFFVLNPSKRSAAMMTNSDKEGPHLSLFRDGELTFAAP
jgi:hypothetical protein